MVSNLIRQRRGIVIITIAVVLLACLFFVDVPRLTHVMPDAQDAIFVIHEPERQQFFYGTLAGTPHTYAFSLNAETRVVAQLMMPDVTGSADSISAIIVRLPEGKGRVEEVARLRAADAAWSRARIATSDTLRQGPSFDAVLEPGAYRLEIHTSDNIDRYVLRMGTNTRGGNYFSFLAQLGAFKKFLGSSVATVLLSPFVFIPFGMCVGAAFVWRACRKQ